MNSYAWPPYFWLLIGAIVSAGGLFFATVARETPLMYVVGFVLLSVGSIIGTIGLIAAGVYVGMRQYHAKTGGAGA